MEKDHWTRKKELKVLVPDAPLTVFVNLGKKINEFDKFALSI